MDARLLYLFLATIAGCTSGQIAAPTEQATRVGADRTASEVHVTTDKSRYRTADPVVVTINNPLQVPIYALTGQTYCTIVTLQRHVDDQWQPEGRCIVGGPPGWRELAARQLTRIDVKPMFPADQPLEPSRYRVAFTFRPTSTTEASTAIYSEEFVIERR